MKSITENIIEESAIEISQSQDGNIQTAVELNQDTNQLLTQRRDTLLPKLISGEVRVTDVDMLVEAEL